MTIRKHIPNTITLFNLLCGSIAVISTLQGDLITAVILMAFAAVFDFMDGMSARLLKAYSAMGKELDSLADMVSFGLLPGLMVYKMIELSVSQGEIVHQLKYVGLLIPLFSALRLAKFNIDEEQLTEFRGVPTPASALFFASLAFINFYPELSINETLADVFGNIYFISISSIIFSLLLVSRIPLFALKFQGFGWNSNKIRYSFLLISLISIGILGIIAIPFIILFYVILSLINNVKTKS
ncbi:MAG: CDP-diacylglycerol--serine O-phosphatidyltransferase [Bacteroidales bacterium]|nr:CDP-diacylglycerol--serine O-phosphatidyltransferase [Bacteroidales bacterium]